MKAKFRLFQRASGVFYIEDTDTKWRGSLKTKDADVSQRLLIARNEAHVQPAINFRRLVVRYERHPQIYEAFFHLACILITLRHF